MNLYYKCKCWGFMYTLHCNIFILYLYIFRFVFHNVAAPKHIKVNNGSGRTGTTTELSCTYEGRPLPTIKWLGFGKDLTQVLYSYYSRY